MNSLPLTPKESAQRAAFVFMETGEHQLPPFNRGPEWFEWYSAYFTEILRLSAMREGVEV